VYSFLSLYPLSKAYWGFAVVLKFLMK